VDVTDDKHLYGSDTSPLQWSHDFRRGCNPVMAMTVAQAC